MGGYCGSGTHEAHFAAVAEQIDDLVIETFVEVVTVGMLQPADGMHIPQRTYFVRQLLDLLAQSRQVRGCVNARHG